MNSARAALAPRVRRVHRNQSRALPIRAKTVDDQRVASRGSTYRALASRSRLELLNVLQERAQPVSVEEAAAAVGLPTTTVREHLERLVETRFASKEPEVRATRGRPRILYRAAARPAGATLDARFRDQLIRVLLAGYQRRDRQLPGTASAPDAQRQIAALEIHLDDLGLDPEVDLGGTRVHLHRCPFADIARERTELVCSVHLAMVRAVLANEGGPLTAERLDPFVGPEHCLLHLRER